MFDNIISKLKKIFSSRLVYISIVFIILFAVLIARVYELQILSPSTNKEAVSGNDSYVSSQYRYNESTRGNIYDRNGNLLVYNVLSYSVVMSNSGLLGSNAEKNAMIYKLIGIIEEHNYEIEVSFPIEINEDGELCFNVTGNAELRFKKNAYGLTRVSLLSDEQKAASAQEVFDFLRYGKKNVSSMFNISEEYSLEDTLKIMTIRYALLTLAPQYSQFTLCSDVDEPTIAAIKENSAELLGVEVKQQTSRVYNDSKYFAHIVGYTGVVTDDEKEALNTGLEEEMYYVSDVIGKTGVEKEMDDTLRGKKGVERLSVNKSGKVLTKDVITEPLAGDDIYLTIDRELQIACYHILENNIAAILISKIVNSMDYGGKGEAANKITIPIYEVYNAFVANSVLDIAHFRSEEATELEQTVYNKFLEKRTTVLDNIEKILSLDSTTNSTVSTETKGYLDYIYSMLRTNEVLLKDSIDIEDDMYEGYTNNKVSLSSFLQYAINEGWIDVAVLGIGDEYYSTDEVYDILLKYIFDKLDNNNSFEMMIYKVLIFNSRITGRELCMLLYEQGVIEYNENDYNRLKNGRISAYSFVIDKLTTLEINPGMLALEPCSGSIVITDVNTGDVLCMVTYPSYDNNKLANKIDWEYYQGLMSNEARPLYNRPTQQLTATGSTFKPLMALAGLGENIISTGTTIKDQGIFEEIVPSPKCWKYPSNHGNINLTQAIQHSCNYFFYEVGYEMALDSSGNYSDSLGIAKIQKYAAMFGLSEKSGVEVPEAQPAISSIDAVRTAIGYYHSFTPIQISRYVTAIANKGKVFNLTLVDKILDKDKNLVVDNHATVYNQIDIYSDAEWNAVQKGMYNVVNTSANSLDIMYGNLGFDVAGKTGTAQISLTHPSNGLFISFAPFSSPEVSVTVVLPNGYASANAAKLAREVYGLYFNAENKEELLSGDLTTTSVTSIIVSD